MCPQGRGGSSPFFGTSSMPLVIRFWLPFHRQSLSKGALREIRAFPVPVPPLPEQRTIITHLDDLQAQVDALKKAQAETSAELDVLMPSILDKAFRGELLPATEELAQAKEA
jgi:hypothetical protein